VPLHERCSLSSSCSSFDHRVWQICRLKLRFRELMTLLLVWYGKRTFARVDNEDG
jgi:hypothetical protein